MPLLSKFFCCFSLRTGALLAGFYVLTISCVFLVRHAAWLRLMTVGQVPDILAPFIVSMMRDKNASGSPTINITAFAGLHRRYIAGHILHLVWAIGGMITSLLLLNAVIQRRPLMFLPWLSWSSVNSVILMVNAIVDILLWAHYRIYSSMNILTLLSYVKLPFLIYLIFVTISYYQIIESIYDTHNGTNLCCIGSSKTWTQLPTDDPNKTPVRTNLVVESNERVVTTPVSEVSSAQSPEFGRHPANGNLSSARSLVLLLKRNPNRQKPVKKPPKIRVIQPSIDEDW